jgi:hypothetical protein
MNQKKIKRVTNVSHQPIPKHQQHKPAQRTSQKASQLDSNSDS